MVAEGVQLERLSCVTLDAILKTELVIFHICVSYFIHIQNMASEKQTPPVFAENMLYKTWENKTEMWKLVNSVEAK